VLLRRLGVGSAAAAVSAASSTTGGFRTPVVQSTGTAITAMIGPVITADEVRPPWLCAACWDPCAPSVGWTGAATCAPARNESARPDPAPDRCGAHREDYRIALPDRDRTPGSFAGGGEAPQAGPWRRANAAAAVRFSTPSLARMRATWCSTVRALTKSA